MFKLLNFSQAMEAVDSGASVIRLETLRNDEVNVDNMSEVLKYEEEGGFFSSDDLDARGFSRQDIAATDWISSSDLPKQSLITEEKIIAAWNAAMGTDVAAASLAPNSARYKRFKASLGV